MVHRHVHVVITALATAATVLTGGACATPAVTAPDRGPGAIDQAFGHVHGIELNPANGRFYAATHHGVFQPR